MADIKSQIYTTNEVFILSSIQQLGYTRNGYFFQNWKGPNEITLSDSQNVLLSVSQMSLSAKWNPIKYTITYDLNGGVNNAGNPSSYTIESPLITLKPASKFQYIFNGWYENGEKISDIKTGSYGNRQISASYEREFVTVFYDNNAQSIIA